MANCFTKKNHLPRTTTLRDFPKKDWKYRDSLSGQEGSFDNISRQTTDIFGYSYFWQDETPEGWKPKVEGRRQSDAGYYGKVHTVATEYRDKFRDQSSMHQMSLRALSTPGTRFGCRPDKVRRPSIGIIPSAYPPVDDYLDDFENKEKPSGPDVKKSFPICHDFTKAN